MVEKFKNRTDRLVKQFERKRFSTIPKKGMSVPMLRGLENFVTEVETTEGNEIITQLKHALRRTPADYYYTGEEIAKPGTVNDPFASIGYVFSLLTVNPNLVDSQMFLGPWELAQEAKTMTAGLLNLDIKFIEDPNSEWTDSKKPPFVGGWFLSGGTESITQATWAFRNLYFARAAEAAGFKKEAFSIRKTGTFNIQGLPSPTILAPVNAHLALVKAGDITGYGMESPGITNFYLQEDGRVDLDSFRTGLQSILTSAGKTEKGLSYVFVTAGDTERGIISDTHAMANILQEEFIKNKPDQRLPPILVDSAAQYLFAEVMDGSPNYTDLDGSPHELPVWDFRVPEVSAIVVDPHKNQIPYPSSILIYRNPSMMKLTSVEHKYLSTDMHDSDHRLTQSEKDDLQVLGSIPTSRGGYGAIATWMYYLSQGMDGMRARKERVWNNVKSIWSALEDGDLTSKFELMTKPETAIVTMRLRPEWVSNHNLDPSLVAIANKVASVYDAQGIDRSPECILAGEATYQLYLAINGALRDTDDMLYVGKSTGLRTRSKQEYYMQEKIGGLIKSKFGKSFAHHEDTGILVHVMEHNRPQHVAKLIGRLNVEAANLLN
jgi:glutamate/tyrosine decarboxylase-like PLP-dependent enzyme